MKPPACFTVVCAVTTAARYLVNYAVGLCVFRSFHFYYVGDLGACGYGNADVFAELMMKLGGEGGLWEYQSLG